MPETLRDFIDRRLRELRDAEAPIRAQLNEIERERRELEKTAKLIGIGIADRKLSRENIESYGSPKQTIKEAVLEILAEWPRGLTAVDILREINNRLNTSYVRTSLSPQLSRLKRERKIEQRGIVWSLVAAETNRAPIGITERSPIR
jgi:hypothetical protein